MPTNKPQIDLFSNHSFSFSRNKSFIASQYGRGFEPCAGWELLKRAITKVVWSPCVFADGRRQEKYFLFSDVMALDFDSPETTIREIAHAFRDCPFIIAPTRNHQREKGGVVCERFRLVTPWERRITTVAEYRASIASYVTRFRADKACIDGARFFFPSSAIDQIQDPADDMELASVLSEQTPQQRREYPVRRDAATGKARLSRHVTTFLLTGRPFGEGRMVSCFVTACELRKYGVPAEETLKMISRAPFDRVGFRDSEIHSAVKSAYSKQ